MNFFRHLNYKIFLKQWRGVLIVAPSIAGLIIILRLAGWLQLWELMALDRFFQLRPAEPPDNRIVIIGITESDIEKVQTWPFRDALIAELLEKVKQQQPQAIGLDIYRDLQLELTDLKTVGEEATSRYFRLSNIRLRIGQAQPAAPADMLRLLERAITETELRIPALKRSIQEIKMEWNLS